jgi:hypothetical protein
MLAAAVGAPAQEWSEAQVIDRFLQQSPQTRELRARIAVTQAEARGRSLYPNPTFNYSREEAGFSNARAWVQEVGTKLGEPVDHPAV